MIRIIFFLIIFFNFSLLKGEDITNSIEADKIEYLNLDGKIKAIGSVKIIQNEYELNADEISFNQKNDIIEGTGNIILEKIGGEKIFASKIKLSSDLTNGIISNYAQMEKRRLVHKLGVVYETSPKLMKLIPIIIKKIVEETKDASFDRCHFTDFGDFSLNFELVYYIPTNNYLAAMEAQQSINLRIIEEFAANNIEFAFPTQTLNIESNKAK